MLKYKSEKEIPSCLKNNATKMLLSNDIKSINYHQINNFDNWKKLIFEDKTWNKVSRKIMTGNWKQPLYGNVGKKWYTYHHTDNFWYHEKMVYIYI